MRVLRHIVAAAVIPLTLAITATTPATAHTATTRTAHATLPSITPAANSPALKQYSKTQVAQALGLIKLVATGSVTNPRLLTVPAKGVHPISDYAPETQYLSRSALASFKTIYSQATKAHNTSAEKNLIAFAEAFNSGNFFRPDTPSQTNAHSLHSEQDRLLDAAIVGFKRHGHPRLRRYNAYRHRQQTARHRRHDPLIQLHRPRLTRRLQVPRPGRRLEFPTRIHAVRS